MTSGMGTVGNTAPRRSSTKPMAISCPSPLHLCESSGLPFAANSSVRLLPPPPPTCYLSSARTERRIGKRQR